MRGSRIRAGGTIRGLSRAGIRGVCVWSALSWLLVVVVGAISGGCIGSSQPETSARSEPAASAQASSTPAISSPQIPAKDEVVMVGAGDIAGCKALEGAKETAKLIAQIPGTVFALGDLAYESGSAEEFHNCYDSTWGAFKNRTRPAPGNHEYAVNGRAPGYFQYWGAQAGSDTRGYYSYDLGAWHIVSLNTNCHAWALGGCAKGSPQEEWLRQDLAQHSNACVMAYGHHPLFSSGLLPSHAMHPELRDLWRDLYAAHAALFLVGHEHSYERFAAQDPEGHADPVNGIREIVVGTGGRSHDPLGFARPNSEVRNSSTYGVLKLTLMPGSYTWQFIPVEGETFTDSGTGFCPPHGK
jgi:acid phosphatase type 7